MAGLLQLPLPETIPLTPALQRFRRDLIAQIQQEREQAVRIFELDAA